VRHETGCRRVATDALLPLFRKLLLPAGSTHDND